MEQTDEEKRIEQIIAYFDKETKSLRETMVYGNAKMEEWEPDDDRKRFLSVIEAFSIYLPKMKDSFASLLSWNKKLQAESKQNRELLLKLLGLMPDATEQDILDAIDDVAPVFANYRKKKRGT